MIITKKVIKICAIIIAACLLISIIFMVKKTNNRIKRQYATIEYIPNFIAYKLNNVPFTKDSLNRSQPTVFVHFNTDCDFCVNEIFDISKRIDEFWNIQFIFISVEPVEIIRNFVSKNQLKNSSQMIFLCDRNMNFVTQFNIDVSPYTILYDKKGKYIVSFKGQSLAFKILKELQKYE